MKKLFKKNFLKFENLSSDIVFFQFFFFTLIFSYIFAIDCPNGYWKCSNDIQCINSTLRCNNIIDCQDGSDEGTFCNTTCSINEFKCATGNECIIMDYVCDHDKDCSDGSDEHSNCTYPLCGYGKFTCANRRCINENFICDGENDCLDNSDEKFCASRHCPPNQLACNKTGKCIDIQKFCNGIVDCPDGSDESSTCSSIKCPMLSCTHRCKSTPTGGICFCPQGQTIDKSNNRTCVDVNECEMWDECDQICVNSNNSYSCQCHSNYTLQTDGHCQHITSEMAKIIFSVGSKMFETNQQGQSSRQILNNDDLIISSFDFNYDKKIFYLADDKNNKVFKAVNGSNGQLELSPLITSQILAPFQISIDWITGNIYLLQKSLARIDVFSADGKNRTNLLTGLFNPTSFSLDPHEGLLFFTDSGFYSDKLRGPRIEKALMDGRNRQVLVKDKLLEPIAITVDLIKKRLFWIDRKYDHLETSDYFGMKRFIIASGSRNLPHSVSLDLFEKTVYFADSTKMAIMKLARHAITKESNVTNHFKVSEKPLFVRVYHQTKQPETENPCQSNCEHFCLLSHGQNSFKSYRCKCKTGYRLRFDLKSCEKITTTLFISQSNFLKALSLDSPENTETLEPLIMPRNGAIQIFDLDIKNNRTFFYDSYRHAIFESVNNQEPRILIPDNVRYVNNLAYDWITNNLFYVTNNQIVVVSLSNLKKRRVLIYKAMLEGFRIDPKSGFMFYSSIARPAKIYRAFLDGTNETVIIPRGLSLPYSLELDLDQNRLYWSDSHLSLIQYSDYNGRNIRTLLQSSLFVPFSILVFRHNLYFVDIRQDAIFKISKTFALTPTILIANLKNIYSLKMSEISLQTRADNHPCLRQNGDCSDFCFSVPSLDAQYTVSRHCGCPYGFMLDSNKLNCIVNSSEAQTVDQCKSPFFFKCSNERCIFRSEVCDGINDCLDMSDEINCPVSYCTSEQFKCRNGTCIEKSKRCDGIVDCTDYSDEMFCPQINCDANYQFKCNNGSCIPISWKCDTENDCGDSSDEIDCVAGKCDPLTQFECHGQDGRCIDKSLVCNGRNDCLNNHDEENCPQLECSSGEFKCVLDNICINSTKKCDGIYDCPSLTDEQNCRIRPVQTFCLLDEFSCGIVRSDSFNIRLSCIPKAWVCDGHKDCDNGQDELSCPKTECDSGYFRCNNTKCVPNNWKCDGEDDCGDNSDEKKCPGLIPQCKSNEFTCEGTLNCINLTQLCNNYSDCPDGSDEGAFCSRDDCSIQNGGCSHYCHQSPMGSLCFCPQGFQTTNLTNFKRCEDINECEFETSCNQKCTNFAGGYFCACESGYFRSGNACKALTRHFAKIYITNGRNLIVSNIEGNVLTSVRKPSLMQSITAFDFNNRTGRIYWADSYSQSIYSSFENGSNTMRIISGGITLVEAISVDWIGNNIYWADYRLQHIEVAKVDGSRRKILINVNVTNPRGLVIDPRSKHRFIFWTDWGKNPRIERASMDGTNRIVIVSTKLHWPNGLAIDLIRERIYFADAHLDYIESCDYNGNKRVQIIANDLMLHHPHSLAFFEHNIFWIDRGLKKIVKLDRLNPKNKTIIAEISSQAMVVKVVHQLQQPYEQNPCISSNCEHLCLLASNQQGYTCECQIGYLKDPVNKNRCNIDQSEFLIVLNKNMIGGMKINLNDFQQPEMSSSTLPINPINDAQSSNLERESGFLWDRMVTINNIKSGFDLTYSFNDQMIFWLEHENLNSDFKINQVRFDGEQRRQLSVDLNSNFGFIYCLDFDPSSRNIFLGNMQESQIEVVNIDNYHRAVILSGSLDQYGVGKPISIVVNYEEHEIYWIDSGYDSVPKKIAAVSMDGSSSRILVKNDLVNPQAVIYHRKSARIYWSDSGRKKIESISRNNLEDRSVVLTDIDHVTALAIWDADQNGAQILYYSDQIQEIIVAYNLRTSEKRIIKSNVGDIYRIKIYQKFEFTSNFCSINNGNCHQICLPLINSRVCKCSNGLELQPDGSCKPFDEFIIYSTKSNLMAISLHNQKAQALPTIAGFNIKKIDFDFRSKSIFWIEDDRLVKTLLLNYQWTSSLASNQTFYTVKTLFELDTNTGTLLSLTYDWINKLLYYSYSDQSYSYIKVTRYPQVDYHLTILQTKTDKPSLLAVNPILKYLYWIDQAQNCKIERSFLDGSNRTVLLNTDILSPTDLAIDPSSGDLYWSDDSKDKIEKCDWNGQNRSIVKSDQLPSPKSIFYFNSKLFYADSRLRALFSLNLSYSNNSAYLLKKIPTFDLNELAVFSEKAQPLVPSACAINPCDQFCFSKPTFSTVTCSCGIGEPDGRVCKLPDEYVIFAMENEVRSLNLPVGNLVGASPWRSITGLSLATGIDFDYKDNLIFFSDLRQGKLKSFIPGSENSSVKNLDLNSSFVAKPEGISFDWVSDTVFYTDNGLNQIRSFNLKTKQSLVLAFSDSPRAIVVHPCKGYVFWTDVGRAPMIARIAMSGSNFEKLVVTDIKWPNGLCIDFDNDQLYWADAYYDKIETSDLDGNYRRVIATAFHPFALAVHGHYLYWTDWNSKSVYRAEKYRGSNVITLVQGLPKRPMDIQVWSKQRQKCDFNPCSIYNGGCSHICSVVPGNRTECRCPFGMNLRLTNNDKTCTSMSLVRCNSTQFTCSNGACISKKFVCDGQRNCADGSDEAENFCAYHSCLPSEFRCRNGRCISAPERCDRVNQCGDNSDEQNCIYPTCNSESEFQCKNFKCIPISSRCDGIIDCDDGNSTDEINCPPINCTSPVYNVKCPNTNLCIMRNWLCDGDNDCGDSADENKFFCDSIPCESNKFRCNDNRCIPFSWVCDGDKDCSTGEDEPVHECRYGNVTCPEDMFKCDSGRCINKKLVCDGDFDCPDKSDESEEKHNCLDRPCRGNEFKCESGVRNRLHTKCIRLSAVCDGYPHCVNSEDETNANCTRRACRSNEFQCNNGLCVNEAYKCDHDDDCGDGSDEPHNCTYKECSNSQYKCDNQRCISISLKCNGRNDCIDNSDEKPELCKNTTCSLDQFTCRNKKCIPMNLVCNQQNDCEDNSDETGCGINECASPILNKCQHICRDTLTSFECQCQSGFKLVNKFYCVDINECSERPYVCPQLCENTLGSYVCKCANGYEKSASDSTLCKLIGPKIEADLLFSNNYYLRNISLTSLNYNLIKDGFGNAKGIAYDYNQSQVFVIDSYKKILLRLKLNTSVTDVVISEDILLNDLNGDESDVAFDWINKKIYFINSNKLMVTDQNGHYKTTLLDSKFLKNAISLSIDPIEGYLFISDSSFPPFIARVKLNGENFTKIIWQNLGNPVSLTLDLVTKRIFWTDTHLRHIEFSDYNGKNRYISIQTDQTAYPFALSYYQGLIYWTDLSEHSIYSANALDGKNKAIIRQNTIHMVSDMNVYHYSLQPYAHNPCGTNNGGCSHLCLIGGVPDKNFTCMCPESFILQQDGKTCTANCTSWHFRCGMPDEKCIPFFFKCDGEIDCRDGSDELNCPRRTCPLGTFQCSNSKCISFGQVCNGQDDCLDLSDEKNCPEGCPPGRFQCPNTKCIPNYKVCDGQNDCGDSADEFSCANITCPAGKFQCSSGHCIEASYYCDEDFDCADRSDEPAFTCRNRPCPRGWTRCGNNSYKCIRNNQFCDGFRDCPSGDDENEEKCPGCHSTGDFKCANNKCIMLSLRCNFVDDCGDNSDERPELCDSIERRHCTESEFKCVNGHCIRNSWRCNHEDDCGDNSDESNCESHSCHSDQWQCNSGHCIQAYQHCNGIRNCLDYSDETSCPPKFPNGTYCNSFQFTCNNTFCIKSEYICDGDNDCGDNSDELLSLCSTFNCSKENNRFRCKNGLCIYADNVCNGFNDCLDGSDEDFSSNGPCKSDHLTCNENQFKCASSHHCIPIEYVCDQDLDCGENDQSDEIGCYNNQTIKSDSDLSCSFNSSLCEHNCTDMANNNGFFCSCHHGFKMVKVDVTNTIHRHTCEDIDECQALEMNYCTHSCLNTKGSFKCKCAQNYIDTHGDGSICEAAWKEDYILFLAYGSEIRQLRPNSSDFIYSALIDKQESVSCLDFDILDRYLYWVDKTHLKRSYIPNSRYSMASVQELGDFKNIQINSLSVDWLGKNIYFYDSISRSIKVMKSDGRYLKTLITENCTSVINLVVNPLTGRLFWINSDPNHVIMSSLMNGEDIKLLVSSHLDHPFGLAIDYITNRLYWSDSKTNLIESIKFDGSDRSYFVHNGLRNPYSIDLFENKVYFLARDSGFISSVDKYGRGAVHKLIDKLDLVDEIKIFHNFKIPINDMNPCSKSSCSHLCLLKSQTEYECSCPDDGRFINGEVSSCDAALEVTKEAPLKCNCFHCWCWYNGHGIHFKCLPGWQGELCEINLEQTSKALIDRAKTVSLITIPIVILLMLVLGMFVFYSYKKRRSTIPQSSATGITSFPQNPHNSEITPSEINQPSLSSFFNPIFNKQSSSEENSINMDELRTESNIIESIPSNLEQDAIFSSEINKRNKNKSKKKNEKKKSLGQYDPTTRETVSDKANLVDSSE